MKERTFPCRPFVLGVHSVCMKEKKGIQAGFVLPEGSSAEEWGILLFDKGSGKCLKRHVFPVENRVGNICYDFLEDVKEDSVTHLFFADDIFLTDKYAEKYEVTGNYGEVKSTEDYKGLKADHEYDWENVKSPKISYEDSIIYGLHVRGFTKDDSSKVEKKGTFAGITEKLSYLKELGITAIELQPCYEFDEADIVKKGSKTSSKINYWGYKEGYYYAPKKGYSYETDPVKEFKDMVKACHRAGIEVIMEFYFPETVSGVDIPDILRYWACYYHVDGFHLLGSHVSMDILARDPGLSHVKLIGQNLPQGYPYVKSMEKVSQRLAVYHEGYMTAARRYLKGDKTAQKEFLDRMRWVPCQAGVINYLADHSGFTLYDLVAYNKKHNESNGENERDGTDYNFSWNCGQEGASESRQITALRNKQIRNALVMLFLSHGTPFLFMGDEFCNSQQGNNNPYCQDNEISWLNWNDADSHEEMIEFVKFLIKFRRENSLFRAFREFTLRDEKGCGYPDISYHNEEAWIQGTKEDHHVGILFCGEYGAGCEDKFWYLAINMDWNAHKFIIPPLPSEVDIIKTLSTEAKEISDMEDQLNRQEAEKSMIVKGTQIYVAPRSIALYEGIRK